MQEEDQVLPDESSSSIEAVTKCATFSFVNLIYYSTPKNDNRDPKLTSEYIEKALDVLKTQVYVENGTLVFLLPQFLELVDKLLTINETKPSDDPILPEILRIYGLVIVTSNDKPTIKKVMKSIFLERIHIVLTGGNENAASAGIYLLYAYATKCNIFRLLDVDSINLVKMVLELVFTDSRNRELLIASVFFLFHMARWYQYICQDYLNRIREERFDPVALIAYYQLLINLTRAAIGTLELYNRTLAIILCTANSSVHISSRRTGVEIILRTVIALLESCIMLSYTDTTHSSENKILIMDLILATVKILIPSNKLSTTATAVSVIDVSDCPSIHSLWPTLSTQAKLSFITLLYKVLIRPRNTTTTTTNSTSNISKVQHKINIKSFLCALTQPDRVHSLMLAILDTWEILFLQSQLRAAGDVARVGLTIFRYFQKNLASVLSTNQVLTAECKYMYTHYFPRCKSMNARFLQLLHTLFCTST